jgi:hypothetical protein
MNPHDVIINVYRTTGPESDLPYDQIEAVVTVTHQPTGLSVERICGHSAVLQTQDSLVAELAELVANSPRSET